MDHNQIDYCIMNHSEMIIKMFKVFHVYLTVKNVMPIDVNIMISVGSFLFMASSQNMENFVENEVKWFALSQNVHSAVASFPV